MAIRKKRAYHHGDLKRALTEAAIELLAETGTTFTIRQVAQRVGVTHSAAYRHFEDREALLAEVARRGFVLLEKRVARAVKGASGDRAKVEALMVAYVRFGWSHPAQYDLMFGPRLNEGGRFPELEAAVHGLVSLLHDVTTDFLRTEDRVRSRDVGMAVWSMAHGFTSMVLRRRIQVRSLRAAEAYLRRIAKPLLDGSQPG